MRLRTFTAATVKEAMALVRAELGPDAIIVSSYERPRGRGVEVRAAVESVPAPPPEKAPEPPAPLARLALAAGLEIPAEPSPEHIAESVETLKGLAQLARRIDKTGAAKPGRAARLAAIEGTLAYHGLAPAQIASLVSTIRKLDHGEPALALAGALDARIGFNPVPEKPRRPVMLAGAPGAGKTVTAAKLAARARLAGHRIHVITTDTLRSGALEQLGQLVGRMDARVETVSSPAELAHALRHAPPDAAVFIDTPGTNALARSERNDLAGFIAAADIEPVFVFAAGTDAAEMSEHARLYAALGATRLIMTRLDAARRLGALVAGAMEGRLSIAQVSLSPYLSEPFSTLNAAMLARILFAQARPARDGEAHAEPRPSPKPSSAEQKAS